MSELKHTQGPWVAERLPSCLNNIGATHQVVAQIGNDIGTIALIRWIGKGETDANTTAIAPELLEALEAMIGD